LRIFIMEPTASRIPERVIAQRRNIVAVLSVGDPLWFLCSC